MAEKNRRLTGDREPSRTLTVVGPREGGASLPENVQQVVDVFGEEESRDGAADGSAHHRLWRGTLVGGQVAAGLVLTGTSRQNGGRNLLFKKNTNKNLLL